MELPNTHHTIDDMQRKRELIYISLEKKGAHIYFSREKGSSYIFL